MEEVIYGLIMESFEEVSYSFEISRTYSLYINPVVAGPRSGESVFSSPHRGV
ncbi:hypothetical protein TSUD_295820 [Trifolium subterraneum]|uniref:Uncharacterized protein n=1 Tax=Trifolium subterraneum TaxID=3900 RepID=A0A2Z6MDT3_TRISU|nr:hypothetical protein TSUD_295820 [Trifolium subterraneum]